MTISTKSLNIQKHKLILTMVLASFTGLLSMNQSYASSYYSNDREYRYDRNQGHHNKKKPHTSRLYDGDYSGSRSHRGNKQRYSKHARKHHRSNNRRGHNKRYYYSNHSHNYSGHRHNQRRHYYPRQHNDENRIESYSTNYNGSITYSTYSRHSDPVATIVGGAIGGAIANDISGGDGAATAFGIVTGAVLAGGFGH